LKGKRWKKMMSSEELFLKWALELCSQEGYKTLKEIKRAYNAFLGY
jgi:hypothetical protein